MIIAVVTPRHYNAPWDFVQSLIKVIGTGEYLFIHIEGPSVADNRNEVLKRAKELNDHLLFIDADMVFIPEDVKNIRAHLDTGKDAIAGVYVLDSKKKALFKRIEGDYEFIEPEIGVKPCGAAGTGFLGIHKKVVQMMPPDAFNQLSEGEIRHGTDVSFCHRMMQRGLQLWYDSEIQLGHIRSHVMYP